MYIMKAFGLIAPLIDNTRAVVAPVGELSPHAMTYAREKEYLSSAAAPGHTLVVFSNKLDGADVQMDPVLADRLLAVNKWIYETALSGQFDSTTESFRVRFIQRWGGDYSLWAQGSMVESLANVWVPGYVDFREEADDTKRYRVWFATEQFEQQYDEYQIEVVPPLDDLDVFFMGRVAVLNALKEVTYDQSIEKIQAIKEGYPESFVRGDMYEWYDPLAPQDITKRIPTYWTVVIYGIAGVNVDATKEAIRDYILENSTHTKDEWAERFPEIFTSTEFIFVPQWDTYAIPNRALEAGMYSSTANLTKIMQDLKTFVRGEFYTDEFIESVGEVFGAAHRAITVGVSGGPKNRDGIVSLSMRYPDYINVDTTSVDFQRMAPSTRKFVLTLGEMLATAESMTPDSTLPVKFTRLVRDGVLYLSHTLDRFQLLVLSKHSYTDSSLNGSGEPE